jgi:hypothetical protein
MTTEGEMAERTPEVEIDFNSTEYADSVRIEIEILGGDEVERNKVKMAVLKAVADEP